MYSFLLVIIYMAFISLGLPDSLVGSAWPVMHTELNVPVSYAGMITMVIAAGTVISSLLSDRLTKKLGAGLVTAVSVLMTAVALFGFSVSGSFLLLCLWAVPYGLGAGAVDAALNNYVALHYASRHMSWLHCFWGLGAAASPYIMRYCLTGGYGWHSGYRAVSIIQFVLTAGLFISLPLWKQANRELGDGARNAAAVKEEKRISENPSSGKTLSLLQTIRLKGVPLVMAAFFSYCAVEQTMMLWASSYMVQVRGMDVNLAAGYSSLFFFGITFGRFLGGFAADWLGDRGLIRIGIATIVVGLILVAAPVKTNMLVLAGLVVIGFGCAPVYPAIIHATPYNFGRENSQAVIGVQMASAYIGTTFMPPLFGVLASITNISSLPFYILILTVLLLVMSEKLNRTVDRRRNR